MAASEAAETGRGAPGLRTRAGQAWTVRIRMVSAFADTDRGFISLAFPVNFPLRLSAGARTCVSKIRPS